MRMPREREPCHRRCPSTRSPARIGGSAVAPRSGGRRPPFLGAYRRVRIVVEHQHDFDDQGRRRHLDDWHRHHRRHHHDRRRRTTPVYEVRTGTVKGLGTVLVDGQGFTLYMFVPDKQSGNSTCYGPCAQAWPPLLLPAGTTTPLAGPGVNSALLGTTHRTDGTTQLTYNKWPLYLWVNDSQPGQATGQGINNHGGLWYVLSPQGNEITTTP